MFMKSFKASFFLMIFSCTIYAMKETDSFSDQKTIAQKQHWGLLEKHILLTQDGDYSTHGKLTTEEITLVFLIGFENDNVNLIRNLFTSDITAMCLTQSINESFYKNLRAYNKNTLFPILKMIVERHSTHIFQWLCKHQLVKILKTIFNNDELFSFVFVNERQFLSCLINAIEHDHVEVVAVLISVKGIFNSNDLKDLCKRTTNDDIKNIICRRIEIIENNSHQTPSRCIIL